MHLQIEQYKEQEAATNKNKVERNEPCPCFVLVSHPTRSDFSTQVLPSDTVKT